MKQVLGYLSIAIFMVATISGCGQKATSFSAERDGEVDKRDPAAVQSPTPVTPPTTAIEGELNVVGHLDSQGGIEAPITSGGFQVSRVALGGTLDRSTVDHDTHPTTAYAITGGIIRLSGR